MSIGKIYAAGDFKDAINGYWGPMFSWLLVPFLSFQPTPQFALYSSKILALIIGFFTLLGIRFLSYRFEITENIRSALLFSSIFIILYFAFRFNPVDLLLACFLAYYLYFIFNPRYSHGRYSGMACGLLGGMAFLTKSFALPFFLAHFILFNLLYYFQNVQQRRGVLKNFLLGLAVFLIISGSWSMVISEKYGYLTFGTTAKYNFEEIGPVQHQLGSPIWHGFLNPSNEKAISAWEDPTYLEVRSWSPLESWASFKYESNIIWNNIIKTSIFFGEFSYFSLLIIISCLLLLMQRGKALISEQDIIFKSLLTIILYIAAYILVFVEFRYLYLMYFLVMLMGGYLLQLLFKNQIFTRAGRYTLLLIFVASLLILPATSLIQDKYAGKGTYDLSNSINSQYNIQGNIASNDGYMASLFLTYLCDSHYYGTSLINWQSISDAELEKDLQTYNIDYYLVWGDSKNNLPLLSRYREITGGKIEHLKIYSIKERT